MLVSERVPADSFDILGSMLSSGEVHHAVMAIENSIAGTILQNYRILREAGFWIKGESYLRIKHNLCVTPGTQIHQIQEVHSHPMALNQCLAYLSQHPNIKLVETEDTALSALQISRDQRNDIASISSMNAAQLYKLDMLAEGIETNKNNYTRFFILSKNREGVHHSANKASIYIRIPDQKGQLLKVLQVIDDHDLNLSKLQSFPVLGAMREYFFHLDIEFDHISQYQVLRNDLQPITRAYTELGIYKRATITNPTID